MPRATRLDAGVGVRVWIAVLLVLATALPLLHPVVPPLTDLPGHMARFHVAVNGERSAPLTTYFQFHWALVGNLGADLAVFGIGQLLGAEAATKLVMIAIPPVTAAGMLLVAREAHGRVPSTAPFAIPLVYAYPFQFGFANFSVSVALLFGGVAGWMALGRHERLRLRAALFVPFAGVVFVAHTVGWAMLAVAIAAIEMTDARSAEPNAIRSVRRAVNRCLPLLPSTLLLAVQMDRGEPAPIGEWFWHKKVEHLATMLKNDAYGFDLASATLLYALVLFGIARVGFVMEPRLRTAAAALLLLFFAVPGMMLGSSFADMRLLPYAVAFGLLALRPAPDLAGRWRPIVAAAGLVFCGARIGEQVIAYWRIDADYRRHLAALDLVPRGARIFALAPTLCEAQWPQSRLDHLPMMAVVRRDAFVNGIWPMPGVRLLDVRYRAAGDFTFDPSGRVQPARCSIPGSRSAKAALATFPRAAFDYVWIVGLPRADWPREAGLVPLRLEDDSALYRIVRRAPLAARR